MLQSQKETSTHGREARVRDRTGRKHYNVCDTDVTVGLYGLIESDMAGRLFKIYWLSNLTSLSSNEYLQQNSSPTKLLTKRSVDCLE